jgi:hypothetical protein
MTKIYYLHRGDNIPFYIGKTISEKDIKYQHKNKLGKNIILEVIDEVPTKEWRYWEEFYILLFKQWGFRLENKNNGGCGSVGGYENHLVSQAHKGRISPNKNKGKKILQYDLTGKFIKEWNNINEAITTLSLTVSNESIRQCLIEKSKKSANFIWKNYTPNYPIQLQINEIEYILKNTQGLKRPRTIDEKNRISINRKNKGNKPISQHNLNGEFIKQWESTKEAAECLKLNKGNINNVLKQRTKSTGGYFCKYV